MENKKIVRFRHKLTIFYTIEQAQRRSKKGIGDDGDKKEQKIDDRKPEESPIGFDGFLALNPKTPCDEESP